jgi:hypothetical protein
MVRYYSYYHGEDTLICLEVRIVSRDDYPDEFIKNLEL